METIQKIALFFTVIGAINWGLIGLFEFDLVAAMFGEMSIIARVVYALIGITGLINVGLFFMHTDED